ncbi:MAG: D-alanine--D-alanine ligase [Candidatus Omnitrophica bacterium]|nr:D-alanine--D-alanine ligase [Candidatus Omnitrophota bacterium]
MEPRDIGKIGVLAGGPSNEREISLKSGQAVFKALKETSADCVFLDICTGLDEELLLKSDIDVAFIALHGKFGEDGTVQAILEEAGIPYTGSGPRASRLAIDKVASKEIFTRGGLDVPKSATPPFSSFPVVVKPQFEGSSIGISIAKNEKELMDGMAAALNYGGRVIVEEYIRGRELTVGILDDEPLPVIEILVNERFYNFRAKYGRDDTRYIVPAKIGPEIYKKAQETGRRAHLLLGCECFSRVDMLLDESSGKLFVLEVNSIPGFTDHSLLPKAAAAAGIDFGRLCLRVIETALRKRGACKIGKEQKEI